jgi:chromosome partitioning protein
MYDVILYDTGPNLGILTVNAITASDSVLITVTPQLLSAIGLKLLIRTIEKVQKHINPDVKIEGVLMTMCDTRTNLYRDMNAIMEKTYSQRCSAQIRQSATRDLTAGLVSDGLLIKPM